MIIHDEFGPEKIVEAYDPKTGLHGFLVIDNTTLGVGKGGLRVVNDVNAHEVFRLARAMTFKNTISQLPFGGAKSGLRIPSGVKKSDGIKWFAKKLKPFVPDRYVFGPDMNTGEKEMDVIAEAIGNQKSSTGRSLENGGLPHELGSTGYGVSQSLFSTLRFLKEDPKGMSVAIEGFGNVGTFTMKFLTEAGMRVVAVSDSGGVVYDKSGLDYEKMMKVKHGTGSVVNYQSDSSRKIDKKDIFTLDVDVLIPGARPDSIHEKNVEIVKADIIIEAGNIPMSESIEERLHRKGIIIMPDFIASAGGVISSWVEYENAENPTSQKTIDRMFNEIKSRIGHNTELILHRGDSGAMSTRRAAMEIIRERLGV